MNVVFDPDDLIRGSVAQVEGLIRFLERLRVYVRVVVLPRSTPNYVHWLASTTLSQLHTTGLDGTPTAEMEYAAQVMSALPTSLASTFRLGETEELFGLSPVVNTANRLLIFISRAERFARVELGPNLNQPNAVGMRSFRFLLSRGLISLAIVRFLLEYRVVIVKKYLFSALAVSCCTMWLFVVLRRRLMLWIRGSQKMAASQLPQGNSCCICLSTAGDDVADGKANEQWIRFLCGHTFHVSCSTQWLNQSNVCPNCRRLDPVGGSSTKFEQFVLRFFSRNYLLSVDFAVESISLFIYLLLAWRSYSTRRTLEIVY